MTAATDSELAEARNAFGAGAPGEPVLRRIYDRHPDNPQLCFMLGALLEQQGRFGEALGVLDRACALAPDDPQILSATASALNGMGRQEEAVVLLTEALGRTPGATTLWTNLGVLHEREALFDQALAAYDRAMASPDAPVAARMNRGYVLTRLGRLDEALENNRWLAEAYPSNPDFQFNVAEILLALHRYQDAVAACDGVLEIQPDHAKALIDRGVALAALGRIDVAQRDLDAAKDISPETVHAFNLGFAERAGGLLEEFGAFSIYFHLVYEELERGDWKRREELTRSLKACIRKEAGSNGIVDPNIPFRALGLDLDSSMQNAMATTVAEAIEARAGARFPKLPAPGVRPKDRIRVGYVSPDFRIHPAAFLTRQLYRRHDRSRFEVFGYALTGNDGSWIRQELEEGFDVFRDMSSADAGAIARQIRSDGIDILIDLAGYTNFARSEAFALRPAPVQVSWLGFPCTQGAGYIDYAILDGVVCPEGVDRFWTEKIVRLPHSYFIADHAPRYDASGMSRDRMGLPEKAFVFCCFNNTWKIEPSVFDVWMDLLTNVPASVLWLLSFRRGVEEHLVREAAARGIESRRLVFGGRLPNERHLARYALADLFLDTRYYNAHTTAIDALREGTPVITVPGRTVPSRVAASLLEAAGAPELICKDFAEYRTAALRLAADPGHLSRMRAKLREGRLQAPLFDTPRFIRNLEKAFETMWSRHLDGTPVQGFAVAETPSRPVANRWY